MTDTELDKDFEVMFQCSEWKLYSYEDINVKLFNTYDRKKLPDKFEAGIEEIWSDRSRANNKLWNGSKFRLDSSLCQTSSSVLLNLGISCYKDFLGTNWSPHARAIQELGLKDFGNSQAYMSDALGVGSLVQTSDDYFILLRRSDQCGEAVGQLDIPGGHPEPEVFINLLH